MSDWEIRIPYRSRDDSLAAVAGAAHALQGEDRAVARQLALDAQIEDGMTSAGELLDHVEAASPEARRAMLDRARGRVGLPSTEDVEHRRRFARTQRVVRFRPPTGVRMSPSGALVPVDPDQLEQQARDDRAHAAAAAARRDERERAAQAERRADRAERERRRREAAPGVR